MIICCYKFWIRIFDCFLTLTSLSPVLGILDKASESEVPVSGDSEVLDGELEEVLLGLAPAGLADGDQALLDVQSQVDQNSVRSALDLVVPEQNVGLEEVQRLVDDIIVVCRRRKGLIFLLFSIGRRKWDTYCQWAWARDPCTAS